MELEINIRRDNTVRKERYVTVIKNPYVDFYDSKVIYGTTKEVVQRKAERQFKTWKNKKYTPVQAAVEDDEDCLPFN